jgi:hypothetical protein
LLATYCTNPDCAELNIAKSVPDDLAASAIDCGTCTQPCPAPFETAAAAGDEIPQSERTTG